MNKFKNLILVVLFIAFILVSNPKSINAQITNVNSNFGTTEAILNATITPNGHSTIGWFEYGIDSSLRNKIETERKYVGTTNNPVDFSQRITGLMPNTIYYFRVTTNNGRETIRGNILSFVTVPNTTTTQTTDITRTSVIYANNPNTNLIQNQNCCTCGCCQGYCPNTINTTNTNIEMTRGVRVIDPTRVELSATLTTNRNSTATGYFEWGNTNSLGNITNIQNLNTGNSNNITTLLENITPNITYYYRVVFTKDGKTHVGQIQTFQTQSQIYNQIQDQNINYNTTPTLTDNNWQNQNNNFAQTQNQNQTKTANALFGDNFMPNNIFGWLIVIIILFLILFIVRKIITR